MVSMCDIAERIISFIELQILTSNVETPFNRPIQFVSYA